MLYCDRFYTGFEFGNLQSIEFERKTLYLIGKWLFRVLRGVVFNILGFVFQQLIFKTAVRDEYLLVESGII